MIGFRCNISRAQGEGLHPWFQISVIAQCGREPATKVFDRQHGKAKSPWVR